jgi:hypothetical protein
MDSILIPKAFPVVIALALYFFVVLGFPFLIAEISKFFSPEVPAAVLALLWNHNWIARLLFALFIFFQLERGGRMAWCIGLLSVFTPVFGAVFYLLVVTQNVLADGK